MDNGIICTLFGLLLVYGKAQISPTGNPSSGDGNSQESYKQVAIVLGQK